MQRDRDVEWSGVQVQAVGQIPDRGLGSGDRLVFTDVGRSQWVAGLAHLVAQFGGGPHREGVAQDPVHLSLASASAQMREHRPGSQAVRGREVGCDAEEIQRIGLHVGVEPDQVGARGGAIGEHDPVDGMRIGAASVAGHASQFTAGLHQHAPAGRNLRERRIGYGQDGHGWLIFLQGCKCRCRPADWVAPERGTAAPINESVRNRQEINRNSPPQGSAEARTAAVRPVA